MGFTTAQLADAVRNGLLPAEAVKPRPRPPKRPRPAVVAVGPAPGRAVVTRFEVVLPLPPTANNLFANVPGKGRVRTAAYRAWAEVAGLVLLVAGRPVVKTPVWVTVCVLPGGHLIRPGARWDVGNRTKPVVDLLVAGGLIPDDDREYVVGETGTWDCHYVGPAAVLVTVETVGVEPGGRDGD